jgi:O-antigen/teichoic acid export membrane protein
MSKPSSILANLGYLVTARCAGLVVNLIATAYVARMIGTEMFGVLAFANAYVEYFTLFSSFGFDSYLARAVAAHPHRLRVLVGAAIMVRLVLGGVAFVAMMAGLLLLPGDVVTRHVIAITGLSAFYHPFALTGAYVGLQRMKMLATRELTWTCFNLVGILFFVRGQHDIYWVVIVSTITTLATNLTILAYFIREFGAPRLKIPVRVVIGVAGSSAPFLWAMLLTSLTMNFKFVVLGLTHAKAEVGLFAAAWKLFALAAMPAALISAVFLPRITALERTRERKQSQRIFAELILLVTCSATAVGLVFGSDIAVLLFGQTYKPNGTNLSMLVLAAAFTAVGCMVSTILIADGSQIANLRGVSAGAVVSVALDMALIPAFGSTGAAGSAMLAQLAIVVWLAWERPNLPFGVFLGFAGRCGAALIPVLVLMVSIKHFASPGALSACLGIIAGLAVFLVLLSAIGINLSVYARRLHEMH